MDKEYVLHMLEQRIEELKNRYRLACHGQNEDGTEIRSNASQIRHATKRDINICMLVEELITATPGRLVPLTDEANAALEKILEPMERHRRLRN